MEVVRVTPFFFSAMSAAAPTAGGVEEVIQKKNSQVGINLVAATITIIIIIGVSLRL